MLGIGFVCLLVGGLSLALDLSVIFENYVWHWVCLFVGWVTYVWHWVCLFVCCLGDLCFGIAFVICGNYIGHWVCLFVDWVTYVW